MTKAVATTVAGFIAFLAGVFIGFGLPAVLITGGAIAVVFGLMWESE